MFSRFLATILFIGLSGATNAEELRAHFPEHRVADIACLRNVQLLEKSNVPDEMWRTLQEAFVRLTGPPQRNDNCFAGASIWKWSGAHPRVAGHRASFIFGIAYCENHRCDSMTFWSREIPNRETLAKALAKMRDEQAVGSFEF
jgi:hypothetical protein